MARNKLKLMFTLVLTVCAAVVLASCGSYPESNGPEIDALMKAAPSGEAANPDKVVLRLWSFHTAKEFEFWQSLARQYHELHPDIDIKVEYISSDDYFSGDRLLAALASGNGPDIFFVSAPMIKRLTEANMLYPLTAHFTPEIKQDFDLASLDAVTIQEEIYAIPIETELLGLYYNERMFREHHLAPPATWNDMMTAAQALKSPGVSGLTIETVGGVYQNFSWLPFLWQTGADLLAKDGSGSGLQDAKGEAMYAYFRKMIDGGLLNMQPSRPVTDIGILAGGETAMQITGTWNIRMLETEYADKPIGVVPLPTPDGGLPLTIAGGWKMAVSARSAHTEEAINFLMWSFAGSTDIPLKWVNETKFAYSPRKSVMEAGKNYYRRGLRAVFTNEVFGTERQEPQLPEEINRIFSQSLQSLLYGHASAEEVVRTEDANIERYLKQSAGS